MGHLFHYKTLLLSAILCLFLGVNAQSSAINDSTERYINTLMIADSELALKKAQDLEQQIYGEKDSSSMARVYLLQARALLYLDRYDEAELLVGRASQRAPASNILQYQLQQLAGIIAYYQGDNYRALNLLAARSLKDSLTNASAEAQYVLGRIYLELDKVERSRRHARESLRLSQASNDQKIRGNIYNLLAEIALNEGMDSKVRDYLAQARANNRAFGSDVALARSLSIEAEHLFQLEQLPKALSLNQKALKTLDTNRSISLLPELYLQQSLIYMAMDSLALSDRMALKAQAAFDAQRDRAQVRASILSQLSSVKLALKDSSSALLQLLAYQKLNDSLYQKDVRKMLMQQEISANAARMAEIQKDQAHQNLRLSRTRMYLIIAGIVIISSVLIIFGLIRGMRRKKKYNSVLMQRKQSEQEKHRKIDELHDELKAKNEELLELDRAKTKVFSVLTHDMRQPINQIRSVLELLETSQLSDEDRKQVVQQLKQSVDSSSNALENLLLWSKKQLKGIKTKIVDVHLLPQVWQLEGHINPTLDQKKIKLIIDVPDFMKIKADMNQLDICLKNLVNNAIKFSESGSSITIKAYTEGTYDVVEISDQGVGMSEEQLDKINSDAGFSTIGTMQEKGTGLGILITKEYMQEQGGKLQVASERNKGTSFYMMFPTKNEKARRNLSTPLTN